MEEQTNLIVLVLDGLSALFLGPYGNTWVNTPAIDELAAEGAVAEWWFADSLDPAAYYRSVWSGYHSAFAGEAEPRSLPLIADECDYATLCMSDDREVAHWASSAGFATVEFCEFPFPSSSAEHWEATCAAQATMAMVSRLADAPSPFLAWLHLGALTRAWEAPMAWRRQFMAEGDPASPTWIRPPSGSIARDPDPDDLLGYAHAYAAEVMLADACLSLLKEGLERATEGRATRIVLTAPRGYALGDHGRLGLSGGVPYAETAHVPMIVGGLPQPERLVRRAGIFHSADLFSSCLDLIQQDARHSWSRSIWSPAAPDRVVLAGPSATALRTEAWSCVLHDADTAELYAQPDDRWEANEVSGRRSDVVAHARQATSEFLAAARQGSRDGLPSLADDLREVGE